MKAIHADPREIRKIFAEKFIIPDFQRPYSWEKEECDQLWDDLVSFYDERQNDDKYFLGNIVIHQENKAFVVIDGQQRLTTLLLLIKALHGRAGTVAALEKCLKIEDPLTTKLTGELRLQSMVFENDKTVLSDIIFNGGAKTSDDSKLKKNFNIFEKKLMNWWASKNESPTALNNLILTLLDNVVLLPIHCGSQDDALTIFETINNRGKPLTDADIFKAKLHKASGDKKNEFIEKWNSMENHVWLFRTYMHVLRAKDNETEKEIRLRSYFNSKSRLEDWRSATKSLITLHNISGWQSSDENEIFKKILTTYPNYYWNFPLSVFLHKYGKFDDDEEFFLPEDKTGEYTDLVKETVRYFFVKGVVHNSVNAVRDTVFKVCAHIEKEGDYVAEYINHSREDENEFIRKIREKQYGPSYQRGLVFIASYLNPTQDHSEYNKFLNGKCEIEHILPDKWNHYDSWTRESWEEAFNTLGNLMPLEKKINIKASNEFFSRKKDRYKDSKVQDSRDLLKQAKWYPEEYQERHRVITERLINFFIHG